MENRVRRIDSFDSNRRRKNDLTEDGGTNHYEYYGYVLRVAIEVRGLSILVVEKIEKSLRTVPPKECSETHTTPATKTLERNNSAIVLQLVSSGRGTTRNTVKVVVPLKKK